MHTNQFISYLKTGNLPEGFLGLDGAPNNNSDWYTERTRAAKWFADSFGVASGRSTFSRPFLARRLGHAAVMHKVSTDGLIEALVCILILESSVSNAGFGKDQHGSSYACGPMQTKWAAVMDAGYKFENYLDIVTDRNPLVGIDAGVGYFARMLRTADGNVLNAVAKYNHPQTTAETNKDYIGAYTKARDSVLFDSMFASTVKAAERLGNDLRSAVFSEGERS